MEIKALSGKDICAIIKECSNSEVRELSLGDLNIKFGPENLGDKVPTVGTQVDFNSAEAADPNSEHNKSFLDAIQARTQEDILNTQTLMDDPMAYEEEVMNSFVYQGGANAN